MAIIEEKEFDSVEAGRRWLRELELQPSQNVAVKIIVSGLARPSSKQKTRRKFSETALCGLWKDREELADVDSYVRNLRKPRQFDVS